MFTVFIVDDEELILEQIERDIPWMDNGFEVVGTESNPKVAVERILEIRPDVVFSDLRMPHLDGHTFMKSIREHGLDVEFVMLSAYGTFEDAKTFFQQDGFDYILKPLQIEEAELVLEKLANKLNKKYPNRETLDENINPAFVELAEYVRQHFNERFTLEKLGKMFGLSAGYICNLFSKNYNTTLTCFVTKVRMEHAAKLIKEKDKPMKTIASECGYHDYFYFSKVFKGYYGVAPSQFEE